MQAETGLMSMTGTEAGEVVKIGPSIADISTGMYSSIGLLTALYHRERTGEGQYLDVAMFDAQFGIMNNWALSVLGSGEAPRPMGVGNPALAPYQTIATADGDYMLGCGNDGHWRRSTISSRCWLIPSPPSAGSSSRSPAAMTSRP